jgi:uracil-DNA glycosylase
MTAKKLRLFPWGFVTPVRALLGTSRLDLSVQKKWRTKLLAHLQDIELTLVIGQYAQKWHLGNRQKNSLTETLKAWREYWPTIVALPHPSPRNNIWLKKNDWFESDVLPTLREKISKILLE